MTQIAQNYAHQFAIDRIQPNINHADYYMSMAKQLFDVAENYNKKNTEDIFMGYVEVIRFIEMLAAMYGNKASKPADLNMAKHVVFQSFGYLLNDLQNHFESYPDEITKRDILNGKALATGFNMQA